MEDFEERLLTPFRRGLGRFWPDATVTAKVHIGKIPYENELDAYRKLKPKYPDRQYMEVFIKFPENYCRPGEYLLAPSIPQISVAIMHTLGLEACSADAEVLESKGLFVFWVPVNKRVYVNLPPIPTPLTQAELEIEWIE